MSGLGKLALSLVASELWVKSGSGKQTKPVPGDFRKVHWFSELASSVSVMLSLLDQRINIPVTQVLHQKRGGVTAEARLTVSA